MDFFYFCDIVVSVQNITEKLYINVEDGMHREILLGNLWSQNTAVLIHGCHVGAKNWHNIVIGDLPSAVGRATFGLEIAVDVNANLIIWGTGASECKGKKEAQLLFEEATIKYVGDVLAYLNRNYQKIDSVHELAMYVASRSVFDIESQNTKEEIAHAARIALDNDIHIIIQVSSPTHIARCFQESINWKVRNPDEKCIFIPFESDTCYANSTADEVVIIEPPHRADRATFRQDRLAKAMLGLRRLSENRANDAVRKICQILKEHNIPVDLSKILQ
jgi:hypothetical protein